MVGRMFNSNNRRMRSDVVDLDNLVAAVLSHYEMEGVKNVFLVLRQFFNSNVALQLEQQFLQLRKISNLFQ